MFESGPEVHGSYSGCILRENELNLSHGCRDRDFQKMRENSLSERRVLRTHLCSCEPEACAQCHKCGKSGGQMATNKIY